MSNKCFSILINMFINDDEQGLSAQILEKVVKNKQTKRNRKKRRALKHRQKPANNEIHILGGEIK